MRFFHRERGETSRRQRRDREIVVASYRAPTGLSIRFSPTRPAISFLFVRFLSHRCISLPLFCAYLSWRLSFNPLIAFVIFATCSCKIIGETSQQEKIILIVEIRFSLLVVLRPFRSSVLSFCKWSDICKDKLKYCFAIWHSSKLFDIRVTAGFITVLQFYVLQLRARPKGQES